LSQLIVFNAAERSPWALLSGVRLRTSDELSLFVSYAFLRLQSGDGWLSAVHNLSFGAVITL
jgi:hypothetical protein